MMMMMIRRQDDDDDGVVYTVCTPKPGLLGDQEPCAADRGCKFCTVGSVVLWHFDSRVSG